MIAPVSANIALPGGVRVRGRGGVGQGGGGAAATYITKVLGIQSADLIAYWPMDETSGTNIIDASGNLPAGVYTNVTVNDALGPDNVNNAPLFNGASSQASVFSSELATAFNGLAFSLSWWQKVASSGVWTDGISRYFVAFGDGTVNGSVNGFKRTANNSLDLQHYANGELDEIIPISQSETGWVHWCLTSSDGNDRLILYKNGTLFSQVTLIGTWNSTLTYFRFGSNNTPALFWSGWLAHAALWSAELAIDDIQELADPNP